MIVGDEKLSEYIRIISLFVSHQISAEQFEREYLTLFKLDPTIRPEAEFLILDKLFSSVDAFCPDPKIRNQDDLDEEQLRSACSEALGALEALRSSKDEGGD